ncbi:MAG: hypothetical protein ACYTXY_01160 [Nostoc sp.]
MKKPLSLSGRGSFETIIQQASAKKRLIRHIGCHSLTDCLNILENSRYTGDTAIFFIASLQILEVGA